jgi:hypothetical protein
MNEDQPSQHMSRATRFYAWLLRLYPASWRPGHALVSRKQAALLADSHPI